MRDRERRRKRKRERGHDGGREGGRERKRVREYESVRECKCERARERAISYQQHARKIVGVQGLELGI